MGHILDPGIIKACDIRGIFGEQIDGEDAYHIGKGYAASLISEGLSSCVLGCDSRLSSPMLKKQFLSGLLSSGIEVYDLGMVPTPAVYFSLRILGADAGAMITASHNPKDYNGVKLFHNGSLFHGSRLRELESICCKGSYLEGEGTLIPYDIADQYTDYLLRTAELHSMKPLQVIWDPGNGAASEMVKLLVQRLPGSHTVICGEADGSFPNHHPDPSEEKHMGMLKDAVTSSAADLGIALDGDGDRVGVVDSRGRLLSGDTLLAIFAREMLKERPGAKVLSEVKAGRFLFDEIEACGGIPVMGKVGYANQKEHMRQERIPLAGETSGHIFFEENFGYDDGLYSAMRLLRLLSRSSETLAEMVESFPKRIRSGEVKLLLPKDERTRLVADIAKDLRAREIPFSDIDGVRVDCGQGFWMIRSSNTGEHLTVHYESPTEEGFHHCEHELVSYVAGSGYVYESLLSE